jgi:hypothetical protein
MRCQVDPLTLVLVETFKIRNGRIREVEAVFTELPGLRFRGLPICFRLDMKLGRSYN